MSVEAAAVALRPNRIIATHRTVIRLALPMTLAHMSTPLLGFADATIIGRLGQAHLLGAIAAAAVIFDFVFWAVGFLRLSTASFTSQAVGAGDAGEEKAAVVRALIVAALIAAAFLLLRQPIACIAFTALGASPAVSEAARSYYDIRIWAAPFTLMNYVVLGAVIGRGRTDIGLILQIFVNVTNILFNIALVVGLSLGVRGSALGTLSAEALGTVVGLIVLWRLHGGLVGVPWPRVFERKRLVRMFGVNRDIMIRSASLVFAFAFFTAQGARGGDATLAANAVLMNLFLISAYFLDGFATAAEQMCGQSVGARDPEGFRRAVRLTLFWCVLFSLGASAVAFAGGSAFIAVVSTNDAVRELARTYLPFAALTPLAGAAAFEFDGVFIGATWTRDMRNLMLGALASYLALFYALRPFGNTGLWLALLAFLLVRGGLQGWRYRALVASTFPQAQAPASLPTASESAL